MTNKDKYKELCIKEKSIPIFSQYWWMDAVAGEENWDVILVENNKEVIGALPYYFKERKGYIFIDQPKITHKNGIWIKYPINQKYSTRLKYEKKVIKEIVCKLESLNIGVYNQNFDYSFTNWLPFHWNFFKATTRYTYVLENLQNLQQIYVNFDSRVRQNIKKASKLVQVKEDLDIRRFYDINKKTFERQNIKVPYSLEFVERLDSACAEHNCRKIFYAETNSGEICAAHYIVWDENSAYRLMAGEDERFRNNQADTLLVWDSIKFCEKKTKKFDFEGSMIENVEKFIVNFGAIQKPYFNISKDYHKRSTVNIILRTIYKNNPKLQKFIKKFRGV